MDHEFPRLAGLPAYILGAVDDRKNALRASGFEVYDFGLGNPDRPSPSLAVERLRQAALDPAGHRYQPSPGLASLRGALSRWYARRHGVTVDPADIAVTLGSKEGLGHLALAVLGPGDVVLAPDPCYPVHRYGPYFAGAEIEPVPTGPGRDALGDLDAAYQAVIGRGGRAPKLAIVNFPHNPTSATVTPAEMTEIVRWAERRDLWLVSDLAYADLVFDERAGKGGTAPSALAVPGARERTVEFFTLSKSYNMAGWRVGFCAGNPELVGALRRIKGYLDYGMFGPIQAAATAMLDEGDASVAAVRETYRERAQALVEGLNRAGWPVEPPRATMFVWAPVPERFRALGSVAFALKLLDEAGVAVAPGVAFGPSGEGYVRFSLVEEIPRIRAAAAKLAQIF